MFLRVTIPLRCLGVFAILLVSTSASASTRTAASCQLSAVQAMVDAAVSGDVVVVPAGTCTWSSNVEIPAGKHITLKGAGAGVTTIRRTGRAVNIVLSNSRLTGFTFVCAFVLVDGDAFRIDHNEFTCSEFLVGVRSFTERKTTSAKGLIDHNEFHNMSIRIDGFADSFNRLLGTTHWSDPLALGTDDAVYIEDNTHTFTVHGNAVDCQTSGRYVFRHNVVTDTTMEAHSSQGGRACRKWEIYNNTLKGVNRSMPSFFLRGGTGVVFDNVFLGSWNSKNGRVDNVRSFESRGNLGKCDGSSPFDGNAANQRGFPCRDQIGRGQDSSPINNNTAWPTQTIDPAYFWNNTWNGELGGVFVANNGSELHIKADRDFFVNKGPKPGYTPFRYPHPLSQQDATSSGPATPHNLRITTL